MKYNVNIRVRFIKYVRTFQHKGYVLWRSDSFYPAETVRPCQRLPFLSDFFRSRTILELLTKSNWPVSISRPRDAFAPLHHYRWLSVVHGCPPSAIWPSFLLLPVLGTVCLCLFRGRLNAFSSPGVPSHDSLPQLLCLRSGSNVVIFGHLNRSFCLLACLLAYLLTKYQYSIGSYCSTHWECVRCLTAFTN